MMVSYSDLITYQRCPKKYEYSRVRNLQKIIPDIPMKRGQWAHRLLQDHYLGEDWRETHLLLTKDFEERYAPWLDPDDERWEIAEDVERLVDGYFRKWQHDDWTPLHVEEEWSMVVGEDLTITFTPDLVIRDNVNGAVWVVDHKTTVSVPQEGGVTELGDLQHLLYLAGVKQVYPEAVGFIFNYLRTKPPTIPRLRQDGKVRDVKRIDTDYETLKGFVEDNDIKPYPELTEKMAQLTTENRFYVRHPLLVGEAALEQAVREAREWAYVIEEAQTEGIYPRVMLPRSAGSRSCQKCPFSDLCFAELLGMRTDGLLLQYEERDPKNPYLSEDDHDSD